jgi:serine/threonine protein kinase
MTDPHDEPAPAPHQPPPYGTLDPESRLAGALRDRYTIERELGRGGMATVYLARDVKHGRAVAIKVLHPELASVVTSERFLLEIRTAAPLVHPHIVALFDSGEADGLLYYTMPFVAGETLAGRLARLGPLPVDEAIRIAREVAEALAYAHARGVVHRDVKPGNILLGDHDHAALADFGLAPPYRPQLPSD